MPVGRSLSVPVSQGWVLDGRGFAPWTSLRRELRAESRPEEINTLTPNLWPCDLTQQGGVCRCN